MKLKRYQLKDSNTADYFGEHYHKTSLHHRWHFGQDKIGISSYRNSKGSGNSTADNGFLIGLLDMEGELLITPHPKNPRIEKIGDFEGILSADKDNSETSFINRLIKMMSDYNTLYLYLSSTRFDLENPNVFTFSPKIPLREVYTYGRILPIRMHAHK